MRTISENMLKPQSGIVIFLAGLVSLFLPHFSGWIDIVFPSLGYAVLLPYICWETLFIIALILLLVFVFISFVRKSPRNVKILCTSLLAGLILLFLIVYPDFLTESNLGVRQRVSFFPIGGQSRIMWAGGTNIVRNDALLLLTKDTDENGFVSQDNWAPSLHKLGVYWIRIDQETQSVIIYIPKTDFFDSAQFGYLITAGQEPTTLEEKWYRLWKLGEGIYFFQL